MKATKRRASSIERLRALLEAEIDSKPKVEAAFAELLEAVADYEAARSLVVDRDGSPVGRVDPGAAAIRLDLQRAHKALSAAQSVIACMSLSSRRHLVRAIERAQILQALGCIETKDKRELDACLGFGELDRLLGLLVGGAQGAANATQSELPDKQPNTARDLLARDVARIMRDTLGMRPAATRDNGKHSRGGALYARLLRATLAVVGIKQVSLGKVIDTGRQLLEHPELERGD